MALHAHGGTASESWLLHLAVEDEVAVKLVDSSGTPSMPWTLLLWVWACLRWGSGGHDPPKFLKSTICPPPPSFERRKKNYTYI